MLYIYKDALTLVGKDWVGSHECVALVRQFTMAPPSLMWKCGKKVQGEVTIAVGTAIATFENGTYPNRPHGNHAAFYVGQNAIGIFVVEQFRTIKNGKIAKRLIAFKNGGSKHKLPSDDGSAYFVVN